MTSASTNLEFGSVVMDYYELVFEHLAWETYHLSEWPFWLCMYGSSMICELLEDMNGVQKEKCICEIQL